MATRRELSVDPWPRTQTALAQKSGQLSVRPTRPAYLSERDFPWITALLDERDRFAGRKRSEWKVRVSQGLPLEAPRQKLLLVLRIVDRLSPDRLASRVQPRQIRAVLFREAQCHGARTLAVKAAAAKLGIAEQAVEDGLFADIPDERVLAPLEPSSPEQISLLCNGELIAQLLRRALRVRITAHGKVRALVRHAKLVGLLCRIMPGNSKAEISLEMSGPFALFRHTRIYARALASLVPRLAWCHEFQLHADIADEGAQPVSQLVIRSGDPIFPARELPPFDSKVEERFAKEFGKLAPEWDVVREPIAVQVGHSLIFPDFELRHRATGQSWLLEIVGYWTEEYLRSKFAALRAAKIGRLILCVDEERNCSDEVRDISGLIVRFRRKVDPRAVLAIVDPGAHAALPHVKPRKVRGQAGPRAARRRPSPPGPARGAVRSGPTEAQE